MKHLFTHLFIKMALSIILCSPHYLLAVPIKPTNRTRATNIIAQPSNTSATHTLKQANNTKTINSTKLTRKPKHPLKILVIETYFPPVSSTAGLNQITGLIDEGHTVHIYAKKKGPLEWAHADIAKYNLMKHAMFNSLPKDLDSYDIIYCMFGYRGRELVDALRGRTLRHAKIVTCFRGADITEYVKKNSNNCYRKLFAKGDAFLPVCKYFKKKLTKLGCDPRKIFVGNSAIDCTFFPYKERTLQPNEPIKIVSVSRLVKKKGLQYSIRAVAELLKKYPHIEYTIVGFGELREKLTQLIHSLGAQNNIKLVGRLSQEQVVALLDQSHIFVLPSITDTTGDQEGIPNSVKEAMAMGLPSISTYHAGIPELITDSVSGFLVPEQDTKAISDSIEFLINNPKTWPPLCRAARKTIEKHYEKNAVNQKLIALFYALLES